MSLADGGGNVEERDAPRGNAEKPAPRTVDRALYGHVPEARELTWTDDYFEGGGGGDHDRCSGRPPLPPIVAVFDFDYDLMESHYPPKVWSWWVAAGVASTAVVLFDLPPLLWVCVMTVWAMAITLAVHVASSGRRFVRSHHAAVTTEGIAYVHGERPAWFGGDRLRDGEGGILTVETVPFDRITNCRIVEARPLPWIRNPLRTILVETDAASDDDADGGASRSSPLNERRTELPVAGLKDPDAFETLVWAMKRGGSRVSPGSDDANLVDDPPGPGADLLQ
jgi:hypothetical protein